MPVRRQELLREFIERVSVIQVANGFQSDAGNTVFLGEAPDLGPDDPLAAIAIVVGDEDPKYQGEQIYLELPFDIQAHARADAAEPWVTVEQIIADIKKAIELPDRTMGGLVRRQIRRGAVKALPREPGSTTVGASVTYVAPFLEVWGDP